MLPLPIFQHHAPRTLEEVVTLLGTHGAAARLIAGGTDLLPNMKHGLVEPEHLISLAAVEELRGIAIADEHLVVGAMTTLDVIASDARILEHAAGFAEACGLVGGPHHRRMGTLGGNVCLDTRCVYYNQTYFWRQSLGFCLKKDGTQCHVVSSGKNCVAAASNDSASTLMVLGGIIELRGPKGARSVAADDFYTPDGIYNTVKARDEIVTGVRIPLRKGRSSAYEKLRRRASIDYPALSVAVRIDRDADGTIEDADLVVSALASRPKRIKAAGRHLRGVGGDALPEAIRAAAEAAYKGSKPLTNIDQDPEWRREMARVLVRRALTRATAS